MFIIALCENVIEGTGLVFIHATVTMRKTVTGDHIATKVIATKVIATMCNELAILLPSKWLLRGRH